ncbi:aminotransferase variant 1 [Sistotremastrum niveocremeum HHB9708]|uniref:Aminotransferase variant 1 n=1 Tax=Sistotremastrum niveocremeum HHB9708 TaxID=1314777 RepID=A0A164P4F1_9AGAM|nr:aminotransferase variant 1 [Sistotremastrum niveocremeum HHB9708]
MAVDLSHHLSVETKARLANPMKTIWRLAQGKLKAGAITLANGDPHPSLFPLSRVDFHIPDVSVDDPVEAWRHGDYQEQILSTTVSGSSPLALRTAMQYCAGKGTTELCNTLQELNLVLHTDVPQNNVIFPGDNFLAEEFSYPGITNSPLCHGLNWVPVPIDSDGIVPDALDHLLETWDSAVQGRRPHVLYCIPVGQNPTGGTLPMERRRKIYELAQKWDIVIIEDDPYYFLQFDHLPSQEPHTNGVNGLNGVNGHSKQKKWIDHFAPSFLSLDVDGRVLRIDTVSKVIAPGMRLGWITCSELFHRHLESLTDSSTQHPHGWGQIFLSELFRQPPHGWGPDGFLRWCEHLAIEYKRKRDLMITEVRTGLGDDWGTFADCDVPAGGMFVWLRVNVEQHPNFASDLTASDSLLPQTNTAYLMNELFQSCLNNGVIVMPAATFAIQHQFRRPDETHMLDVRSCPVLLKREADDRAQKSNFLRLSFGGTDDAIVKGSSILVETLRKFFAPIETRLTDEEQV